MTEKTLYCSFCGDSQHDVDVLVAGPGVNICKQCVHTAIGILVEHGHWGANSAAAEAGEGSADD